MIIRSAFILCGIFVGLSAAAWCCADDRVAFATAAPSTNMSQAGIASSEAMRRLPTVETTGHSVQQAVHRERPSRRPGGLKFDIERVAFWNSPGEAEEAYWDDGYCDECYEDDYHDLSRFEMASLSQPGRRLGVGFDLYSPPDFDDGLIIYGENIALKIGGYVKADFIYDFNAIDSMDAFDTTTIPVGAQHRTNARYHAKQTRLSFDTRWESGTQLVRIYVEGDFFGVGDQLRLRHAYGESGQVLVGRTWTTFTDVAAVPATLDFEGSVSGVNRRQAQARWTVPVLHDGVSMSLAVEDTRFIIEPPMGVTGEARSPSPDFVARLRLDKDWGQFQVAHLYRIGGFQPTNGPMETVSAWGFNFTGALLVTPNTKAYYQIVYGEGIGSYRGLPDAAPAAADQLSLLPLFGWMVGVTHDWREGLSSNITYAENKLENAAFQDDNDVHRTTYMAVNLIWNPLARVNVGIEYLYGLRENIDRDAAGANRLQMAFIFDLP